MEQKRNLGGVASAPILICVIPLQSDTDIKNIVSIITSVDETANVATSPSGITHVRYAKKKNLFPY